MKNIDQFINIQDKLIAILKQKTHFEEKEFSNQIIFLCEGEDLHNKSKYYSKTSYISEEDLLKLIPICKRLYDVTEHNNLEINDLTDEESKYIEKFVPRYINELYRPSVTYITKEKIYTCLI